MKGQFHRHPDNRRSVVKALSIVLLATAVILVTVDPVAAAGSGSVTASKSPASYYDWESGWVQCRWAGLAYSSTGAALGYPTVWCNLDQVSFYSSLTSSSGTARKSWGKYGLSPGTHKFDITYATNWNARLKEYSYGYASGTLTVTKTREVYTIEFDDRWSISGGGGQYGEAAGQANVFRNLSTNMILVELIRRPGFSWVAQGKGNGQSGLQYVDDTHVTIKLFNSAFMEQTIASSSIQENDPYLQGGQGSSTYFEIWIWRLRTDTSISFANDWAITWSEIPCDSGIRLMIQIGAGQDLLIALHDLLSGVSCG